MVKGSGLVREKEVGVYYIYHFLAGWHEWHGRKSTGLKSSLASGSSPASNDPMTLNKSLSISESSMKYGQWYLSYLPCRILGGQIRQCI